jgi:hypothetical protein
LKRGRFLGLKPNNKLLNVVEIVFDGNLSDVLGLKIRFEFVEERFDRVVLVGVG